MPTTQRPFLGNFLAAFRAHSQPLPKSSPSIASSAAGVGNASLWTSAAQQTSKPSSAGSETSVTSPKPINPKNNTYVQTAAPQDRQLVTPLAPLQHNVSPQTHLPRSPPSPGIPVYGPPNKSQPSYPSVQDVRRSRRGSDSSSEGFRDVRTGGEKWFIGGLTAGGEERYYKLSMVKRDKSSDRISTDQMSL